MEDGRPGAGEDKVVEAGKDAAGAWMALVPGDNIVGDAAQYANLGCDVASARHNAVLDHDGGKVLTGGEPSGDGHCVRGKPDECCLWRDDAGRSHVLEYRDVEVGGWLSRQCSLRSNA